MKAKDIINKFNIDRVVGDIDKPIRFCSPLDEAEDGCITFCKKGKESCIINGKYVIVVDKESEILFNKNITYFVVKNPFLIFVKIVKALFYEGTNQKNIHPSVILYDNVEIGKNVIIQAGAIIGADGFGYFKNDDHVYENFPHMGKVVIKDNVEIGANTCIDRGSLGRTMIGRGTKIGNLVHIAHNVVIEEDVIIAPKVSISGSVGIGKKCFVGAGAMIRDGITIGDKAFIGMGSVITKNVKPGTQVYGNPATEVNK
jgi:UDP-3-O-[3-hydroxymyristoyl] glucosamine N-acyltransferase